jgi:dipeptidyl-peptidase-4
LTENGGKWRKKIIFDVAKKSTTCSKSRLILPIFLTGYADMKKSIFLLLHVFPLFLFAQNNISMSDAILKGRTALAPANLRQLQWIPGTAQFTHVVGNKLMRMNASNELVDTLDWLPSINEKMAAMGAPALETLPALTWLDANTAWFRTDKELYTFSTTVGLVRKNWYPAGAENLDIETKGFKAAYTLGNDLWVNIGGKELGVATSEGDGVVYGKSVHRDEFGISKGTYWSPSGRSLAFYRMDERMVTKYPIYTLDSMPAQVHEIRYPFAGAKSHQVTVGIYDTQTGQRIYLQTLPKGGDPEQFLTNIAWTPDDKFILIAVVNRAQNHLWLNQYDATTGAFVKTILEETSDKWVEPEKPAVFVPGSTDQFLWQSERDGYNHLYLCDLSGKVIRQVSTGIIPVINFYGFDVRGKNCFYQVADASGLNRYVMAANLKSGLQTRLSDEIGTHNGLVNSSGDWVLDVFSNATTPRVVYLSQSAETAKRRIVFSAQNPLEGYRLGATKILTLTAPGGTMLNARMILPTNFDSTTTYPALVYVYNGPHVQLVTNTWLYGAELWMHHMAEEGYVVFVLDGRGSSNRGFAFESAIHRHAGDAEIADQLTGIQFLKAQKYINSDRIGVFGWSYGGFMATSLLTRPEAKGVFRCGVAGGPVIDWSMYEIMYTERYMDTPQENPEGYASSSLFNYVDNLSGRLLMIHGSSDDVVLWQHSLRYIRECVRKGKQIDYFVYPEHLHNVLGKDRVHLFEKIDKFFNENLKG